MPVSFQAGVGGEKRVQSAARVGVVKYDAVARQPIKHASAFPSINSYIGSLRILHDFPPNAVFILAYRFMHSLE